MVLSLLLAIAIGEGSAEAEDINAVHSPYIALSDWATLPRGRLWGQIIGIEIDPDGESIWVLDRCGAKDCFGSMVDPIQKFDRYGKLVKEFGAGLFNWPHGFFVDREGNVWATDGIGVNGKGNTVFKFNSDGKLLMTLGQPGIAGGGRDTFNWPSDVLVAPNGDIFVADGHGKDSNARIVKFDGKGQFIKDWGRVGASSGEFDTPHGLAMDSHARLFVADRSNNRIQILIWREHFFLSGSSSDDRAVCILITMTCFMSPTPNPVRN
jgi:DNA-binding beta-propeller fold protein YncE